jgi:hypothetical protein
MIKLVVMLLKLANAMVEWQRNRRALEGAEYMLLRKQRNQLDALMGVKQDVMDETEEMSDEEIYDSFFGDGAYERMRRNTTEDIDERSHS